MEKNTVFAILLSAVIIMGGMVLKQVMDQKYGPPAPPPVEQTEIKETETKTAENTFSEQSEQPEQKTQPQINVDTVESQDFPALTFTEETDLFKITFNTAGGTISQILLLQEKEEDRPISMVLEENGNAGTFNIAFGGPQAPYIRQTFLHEDLSSGKERIHQFSRDFIINNQIFTLKKTYRIIPGEYLIELIISMETPDGKAVPYVNSSEPAYTLVYGPQIGPPFKKIDGRYEIRDYVTWGPNPKNGRLERKTLRNRNKYVQVEKVVNWAAVIGKYFGVIADPGTGSGSAVITWDGRPADGREEPSRLLISRPARRSAMIEDNYYFYIGPLDRKNLARYDESSKNAFGVAGMGFTNAPRTSSWLGWLESILRLLLEFFYKLVPNYGIAIVLLTILIKFILYPFTHKSYESTSKMQAIQPKIKEIQEQYKGDTQKLNAKMAELYKEEGVNPMGGCLPMLFQFPIFIALYGLLNKYFPLRGAMFIPGWITDLSAPEFVWKEFANPINLLIIDIPAIRILPVLYLGGQLLMTKVTQQGTSAGGQQKMLTLGMPIMFFFILYNMPSGLLLYWISMNVITIIQQLVTNKIKKRKAAGGVA